MAYLFQQPEPTMATYDELQAQIEQLQKQAKEIKGKEKSEAIADMKVRIAKYGITAAELGLSAKPATGGKPSSVKSTGVVRYRSPESGETWTGRGPTPKWLQDEIAAGRKKEAFLIDRQYAGHHTPKAG
jgi:DNA-binding protein H-NS